MISSSSANARKIVERFYLETMIKDCIFCWIYFLPKMIHNHWSYQVSCDFWHHLKLLCWEVGILTINLWSYMYWSASSKSFSCGWSWDSHLIATNSLSLSKLFFWKIFKVHDTFSRILLEYHYFLAIPSDNRAVHGRIYFHR